MSVFSDAKLLNKIHRTELYERSNGNCAKLSERKRRRNDGQAKTAQAMEVLIEKNQFSNYLEQAHKSFCDRPRLNGGKFFLALVFSSVLVIFSRSQ